MADRNTNSDSAPDSAADTNETSGSGPVIDAVAEKDVSSAVAVAGHPVHAMSIHFPIALVFATLGCDIFYWWTGDPFWVRVSTWACGFAFATGVLAALAGTAELVLVAGIRGRAASWTHAVAAMTLIAIIAANWGVRLNVDQPVLPLGLFLSLLSCIFAGLAGWHGGKLILHHGIGLMISNQD